MDKPAWMSEYEWQEELRRTKQQMDYDLYYAPEWQKKLATIFSALIVYGLAALVVVAIFWACLDVIGVV